MKNPTYYLLVFVMLFAACWGAARGATNMQTTNYFVYVGTYTGSAPGGMRAASPAGESQGIYVYKFSTATGKLTSVELAGKSTNPSFLAIDPSHRYLYAVNEIYQFEGQKSGSVSAFSIDQNTGKLTFLNAVASGDPSPAHLMVDHTGKCLLVANYGIGSVAAFPILANGSLGKATVKLPHPGHGVNPKRQAASHAHSIYVSADNRFAVSPDLGTDQLFVYRLDPAKALLTANEPPFVSAPAGSGPRHFAFSSNNKFGYLIEEMGSSITTYSYDAAHGAFQSLGTVSTLPPDFKGSSTCAEIFVHPNGKFVYGSNRGHDSIAVFAVDPVKGTLAPIEYVSTQGKTPRGFGIDPTGSYLIAGNQDSDSLVVFHIDAKTGRLTPTGQTEKLAKPVCVVYAPASNH